MPNNPPRTFARTSHGITIRVNGITVGLIQAWNPGQNRGMTAIYELNAETSGNIKEHIPGNRGGQTISVNRYDLYTAKMEQAFGTLDFNLLSDVNAPFDVNEYSKRINEEGIVIATDVITYYDCWFSNLGRSYSATGDRLVMVNATLNYTRKARIQ